MSGPSGNAVLERFVPAFERIVGRTPSAEESKEALAIADVVASSDLDPILLFYLADRRAQEARERIPAEARAAVEDAVRSLRLDAGRSVSARSTPGPWRDLALYAGGLGSAVAVAWTIALLEPRFGPLGLTYGAAVALVVAALIALWREAPAVGGRPVREIVTFTAGLVAAVAIAALINVTHEAPLPIRFAIVAAAGTLLGLLWRSKVM